MPLALPYTIANGDVPDATKIMANYNAIVAAFNAANLTSRTIRGTVNTATPGTIVSGTGFTVSRNGLGVVEVAFNGAYPSVPSVVVTGAVAAVIPVVTTTAAIATVSLANSGGTYFDTTFHFIAIGPV